ncbi:MAG: sterol desaturase family protein [Opitutaceae bacterium]|nr:sterol desaturase family protein [Opitutaceae bacterium]
MSLDFSPLISFGILFLVFLPLERLFAIHRQKVFRPEYGTDVLFFLGQYVLWNGFVVYLLAWVDHGLDRLPLGSVRDWSTALPLWAQAIIVVFLCDLGIYWGHRLQHRIPFLWRFHRVHHTAEHMDWIAAYREHPLDNLYTRSIENLPALLLGFPLELLAGLIVLRGIWGLVIHSNADIPIGPLKYILGSPRLHHWHHAVGKGNDCNFANLMPLMDVIFGTYHEPREMPERYGTTEKVSHNYFAQLAAPFLPQVARRESGRRPRETPSATESETAAGAAGVSDAGAAAQNRPDSVTATSGAGSKSTSATSPPCESSSSSEPPTTSPA